MKKMISAVLASALLFLCACGTAGTDTTPTPEPSETAVPSAKPTTTPKPTPSQAPYTNPLTGEGMDEDIRGQRPWAIMINNLDKALPQCGISQAEIIYEVPAEGGVTRMMAIFTDISDVDPIGSMRSIRPYYADIGLSYDAIIVHAGGSEGSYSEMYSYDMDHLDGVLGSYADKTFYRDKARMQYGYEHSLFTTGEKLIEAAKGEGFSLEHSDSKYDYRLSFSENAAKQCKEDAEYVKIKFNGYKSTSFTYDPDTDLYTAYEYGNNYIDGNSGDNMTFKNIIVLTTKISVIDSVGRLAVTLTGSGEGYFITGGKRTEITWQRDSNDAPFSYFLEDGTKLNLGIGTTYIGIMDDYSATIAFEKT